MAGMKRVLWSLLGAIVAFLPSLVGAAEGRIVVASKIDTEGALLGNMIVSLLEARGLAVDNKLQLGPTNIVRPRWRPSTAKRTASYGSPPHRQTTPG
jgi:glycine betaine/choline ABC-type transport system substrate-binding protein